MAFERILSVSLSVLTIIVLTFQALQLVATGIFQTESGEFVIFFIYQFALPLSLALAAVYLANPERREAFGMEGATFLSFVLLGPACAMIAVPICLLFVMLLSVFYGAVVSSVISLVLNSIFLLFNGTVVSELAYNAIQDVDSEMLIGLVFLFFMAQFFLMLALAILNRWSLKRIARIVDVRRVGTHSGRFVMFLADAALLVSLLKILMVFLVIWNAFNLMAESVDYSKAPLTGTVAFLVTVVPVLGAYYGIPFLLRRYSERIEANRRWWSPRPDPRLSEKQFKD